MNTRIFTSGCTKSKAAALAALIAAGASAGLAQAQCTVTKLTPSDVATSDFFGGAMSMSGSNLGPMCAVGVPADDTNNGLNAGSVRFALFSSNIWFMTDFLTLAAADGAANNSFGAAVALEDPYIVVGAPGIGVNGAAYFYQRSGLTWNLEDKVPAPIGVNAAAGQFGRAVGLSEGYAVIGQPYASPHVGGAINAGAGLAYFFQRQANGQWTLQQTIEDADDTNIETGAHLGLAAAMQSHVAIVGMPDSKAPDYNTGQHGAVHIYRRGANNAWVSETPNAWGYANPAVVDGDKFGAAVSTDGSSVAIGAPMHNVAISSGQFLVTKQAAGTVYILTYSNGAWQPNGTIVAPDPADNANFGSSVRIYGNRVAITAGGVGGHKAYVFHSTGPSTWVMDGEMTDPDAYGALGSGLAFDGNTMLVGDMNDNQNGLSDSGAVYAAVVPQSTGDWCEAPIAVNGPTMNGCTTFATKDGWTNCGSSPNGDGPDIWFSWTPTCSGPATIDTLGSGFDTILSVHSQCPDVIGQILNSYVIACNDDGGVGYGRTSLVSVDVTAGTTYMIRVAGWNLDKGDVTIHIAMGNAPSNDSCSSPQAVAAHGDYPFKTCAANTELAAGNNCAAMVKDIWYVYTPPVTGVLKADTCNSNFDTMLAVYAGASCPNANTIPVACNDDALVGPCGIGGGWGSSVSVSILGGFPYLIRVGSFPWGPNSSGEGSLHVDFTPNCKADFNLNGIVDVNDIFAYLTAWFAQNQSADFDGSNTVNVQDIFAFLHAWFVGCP